MMTWNAVRGDIEEALDLDTAARSLAAAGRHEEAKATAIEARKVVTEPLHQLRRLVAALEQSNWPQVRVLMRDQSVGG